MHNLGCITNHFELFVTWSHGTTVTCKKIESRSMVPLTAVKEFVTGWMIWKIETLVVS